MRHLSLPLSRCLGPTLACLAVLAATGASAPCFAEGKTSFQALVVAASTAGKEVDHALKGMESDFKRNGLAYTSFKLVGRESLSLSPGQSGSVRLPNGTAKVTLLRLEGKSARVKVAAPSSTSEYSMAPGGEAYIDAGAQGASKLFLIIKR